MKQIQQELSVSRLKNSWKLRTLGHISHMWYQICQKTSPRVTFPCALFIFFFLPLFPVSYFLPPATSFLSLSTSLFLHAQVSQILKKLPLFYFLPPFISTNQIISYRTYCPFFLIFHSFTGTLKSTFYSLQFRALLH